MCVKRCTDVASKPSGRNGRRFQGGTPLVGGRRLQRLAQDRWGAFGFLGAGSCSMFLFLEPSLLCGAIDGGFLAFAIVFLVIAVVFISLTRSTSSVPDVQFCLVAIDCTHIIFVNKHGCACGRANEKEGTLTETTTLKV